MLSNLHLGRDACTAAALHQSLPILILVSFYIHGRNNDRAGEPSWRTLTKSADHLKLTALAATTVGAPTNMSL
jgi:hypothetical protein